MRTAPEALLLAVSARLGDVVMTTPTLSWLRRLLPETRLVVGAPSAAAAEALAFLPEIDEVLDRPSRSVLRRTVGAGWRALDLGGTRASRELLEGAGLAPPDRDAGSGARADEGRGLEARFSGARGARGPGEIPRVAPTEVRHQVEVTLGRAAEALGVEEPGRPGPLRIAPQPFHEREVEELLSDSGLLDSGRPLVVLHLGVGRVGRKGLGFGRRSGTGRLYDPERFAEAFSAVPGLAIALTGRGPEERFDRAFARAVPGAVPLGRALGVLELAVLCRRARFLVSADTGPMHVAAAAGAALLPVYVGSDPRRTAPWRPAAPLRLLTGPEGDAPEVGDLVRALELMLDATAPGTGALS